MMEKTSALANSEQAASIVNLQSMGSISTQPPVENLKSEPRSGVRKILFSRWTFVALQVLDLSTTLIAFRLGAMEVNPLVAHLTVYFGRTGGVVASKLIAIAIAMGVKRRIWMINLFYAGIIVWNVLVLFTLHPK
jgi:hypothetical protein